MKKIYVKPSVKEKSIDMESLLATESNNGISNSTPTVGLGENTPAYGGTSDGSQTPSAKAYNPWGFDDEE